MSTNRAPLISPEKLIYAQPRHERAESNALDLPGLESQLRKNIEGEVRFDAGSKAMYAVDASNYRQVPIGVVIPKSEKDVLETVSICRKFGAPLLSRGGGTSLAGQCCNAAVVIDWTKYMHGVLELNPSQRWARVLPGTTCDELRNAAMKASSSQLNWGPDPATHNHCSLGGMIGNNSCGAHAQMSGKVDNNIEELEILLYDGTRLSVGWMNEDELGRQIALAGRVGEIYRQLKLLRERYSGAIREMYPPIPRRVSGYNLDQLIPDKNGRFNVARALVGSEGTLVTILEAKCRLIDAKAERVILVLGYSDVYEAADHVKEIDPFQPTALEGIDYRLYENVHKKGGPHAAYLRMFPEGKGWLLAEFGSGNKKDAEDLAREVMDKLQAKSGTPSMRLFTDSGEMEHIWEVRESGLGATAFVPGEPDTWPGWEDSAVAPEKLGNYLRELRGLYEKYQYNPALYGHFGQGCVHCRVDFDVKSEPGIKKWRSFMDDATDLCVKYGGSLSGEHGDGQSRAEFLNKMFGPELIQAFREYKSIWDPDWKMNPGKLVEAYGMDQNLRLGANYRPWDPQTHFKFPDDHGSFAQAALRCVGIGKCRRKDAEKASDDTMCPSFMVTHEEQHTTRGRAHHLWEMLQGELLANGWRDESVKQSLDLCLSCKGCKGDCPVNVDMATYKAEFLSHYWEGRIRPRHAYAFGLIDRWARVASLWPGMVNLFTQTPGLSHIAKVLAGIEQQRRIPEFAPQTFQAWFLRRRLKLANDNGNVILWPDTFNNFFFPETAQAATGILENAGFNVEVPSGHICCGRPLYDYGMLDTAKKYLLRVMKVLQPQIEAGVPLVVLEPSCASVFRDELHNLFPGHKLAEKLHAQTFLLSEFLEKKAVEYKIPQLKRKALVQGHCHHKSILRFESEESVLRKMGIQAKVLASGCCGMAGSFGFEQDKYDVSIAVGDRVLLPAVRRAPLSTVIIADGFSCREQIAQQTNRHALHLAEVIQMARNDSMEPAPNLYPEERIVEQRNTSRARARRRAAVTLLVVALGTTLLIWSKRKN